MLSAPSRPSASAKRRVWMFRRGDFAPGDPVDHARGSSGSRPVMWPAARMIGYPLFVGRRGSSLPRGLPPSHFARYFVRVGAVLRVQSGNGPTGMCRIGASSKQREHGGRSSDGQSARLWPWRPRVRIPSLTLFPRSAGAAVSLVGWNSGFPGQLEWPPTGSAGRSGGQPDRQPGWEAGRRRQVARQATRTFDLLRSRPPILIQRLTAGRIIHKLTIPVDVRDRTSGVRLVRGSCLTRRCE